ncbi:MAG: potassium channel family protein [Actinophytocola sp.]|uniref:potassium channel family protein n=1 Tax=Actinophytocola sp. TaxID=1872138 RepID=UPI003C726753
MTKRQWADRTRGERRRTVAMSLLRSAAVVAALLAAYYLAPLDRPLDVGTGLRFLLGLGALAVIVPWQVRGILAADNPWLRTVQVVGIGLPLLLVLFASTYIIIAANVPDAFTEPLSRTDGLYFTMTVFATVGFGDITPRTELARIIVTVQMAVGLIAVGVVAKVLFGAARISSTQRSQVARRLDDEPDE